VPGTDRAPHNYTKFYTIVSSKLHLGCITLANCHHKSSDSHV